MVCGFLLLQRFGKLRRRDSYHLLIFLSEGAASKLLTLILSNAVVRVCRGRLTLLNRVNYRFVQVCYRDNEFFKVADGRIKLNCLILVYCHQKIVWDA